MGEGWARARVWFSALAQERALAHRRELTSGAASLGAQHAGPPPLCSRLGAPLGGCGSGGLPRLRLLPCVPPKDLLEVDSAE